MSFYKSILFFLPIMFMLFSPVYSETNPNYVKYKVRQGDTLYILLTRIHLSPVFGEEGSLNKIINLNPKYIKDNGNLIYADRWVHIPAETLQESPDYYVNDNNELIFGSKPISPRSKIAFTPFIKIPINRSDKVAYILRHMGIETIETNQIWSKNAYIVLPYIHFKPEQGENLAKVLESIGLYPVYGSVGSLKTVIQMNPNVVNKQGIVTNTGQPLIIPALTLPPNDSYTITPTRELILNKENHQTIGTGNESGSFINQPFIVVHSDHQHQIEANLNKRGFEIQSKEYPQFKGGYYVFQPSYFAHQESIHHLTNKPTKTGLSTAHQQLIEPFESFQHSFVIVPVEKNENVQTQLNQLGISHDDSFVVFPVQSENNQWAPITKKNRFSFQLDLATLSRHIQAKDKNGKNASLFSDIIVTPQYSMIYHVDDNQRYYGKLLSYSIRYKEPSDYSLDYDDRDILNLTFGYEFLFNPQMLLSIATGITQDFSVLSSSSTTLRLKKTSQEFIAAGAYYTLFQQEKLAVNLGSSLQWFSDNGHRFNLSATVNNYLSHREQVNLSTIISWISMDSDDVTQDETVIQTQIGYQFLM